MCVFDSSLFLPLHLRLVVRLSTVAVELTFTSVLVLQLQSPAASPFTTVGNGGDSNYNRCR